MANYPNHSQIVVWPDISNYQPYLNGALAKAQGMAAISYKISEGLGYIDQTAQAHHDQAVNNGLVPLAYHFLRKGNGAAQAERVATLIHGQHGSFNGIGMMLDVERPANGELVNGDDVNAFVARWRQLNTGIPVGVYSGAWWWVDAIGNPRCSGDWAIASNYNYGGAGARPMDPWWILESPNGGVTPNYVGRAWGGMAFHARQFTDAGFVGGIGPVDTNVFWGDLSAFKRMVLAPTNAPAVTPPNTCPPAKPSVFAGCATIKKGSADHAGFRTGASYRFSDWPVHALQHCINQVSGRGLLVDGNFGDTTDKAVRDFQAMCMDGVHHPERVDGIVGPSTWGALNSVMTLKHLV